ncbi:MAG TPA: MerR family transcriptional regulator [Afifellaceae bacterium]|nr:MerR family transcriptional regulator [Afifellaceae bacterium]
MAEGRKGPEAFRTISEVADELDLPQHVLRFWETRFQHIKPLKRAGGRRYYRPEDVDLLKGIRLLLYDEGLTIKGVQRLLKDKGTGFVIAAGRLGSVDMVAAAGEALPEAQAPLRGEPEEPELTEAGEAEVETEAAPRAANGHPELSPEARRRLEAVIADLLQAKRQLDQAR